jgi:large subunit ribosomal protein L7/L12
MQLSLLEVSDLTEILQKRLNIQMPAMGAMGSAPAAAAPATAPAAEAAAAAPEPAKTEFDVKLTGFEAASKVKIIKEVRTMTSLGLKEAKELVRPLQTPVVVYRVSALLLSVS